MVVLLHAYLVEVVQPTGAMPREIECIGLLKSIIDIMKLGAHRSMPHIERLKSVTCAPHVVHNTISDCPVRIQTKVPPSAPYPVEHGDVEHIAVVLDNRAQKQRLEISVWHCLHSHGTRHDVNHGCAADPTLRTEPSRDARTVYAHRSSHIVNRWGNCHGIACAPSVRPRARRRCHYHQAIRRCPRSSVCPYAQRDMPRSD